MRLFSHPVLPLHLKLTEFFPQVSQGSLVSRGWLVRSARKLEGQHCHHWRGCPWSCRCDLEHQCRP